LANRMTDLVCCGAINWDINLFVEKLPRTGEEVPVKEIQRVSGGTAANVAVAASRLLGPGKVSFIGALGVDQIAERQTTILQEEGVDDSGILRLHDDESGQAYISIASDGSNEIHTYFGANLRLTGESMSDPERLTLIRSAKVCVIMDPPLEAAEALANLCKEHEVTVIWDPGVYAVRGLEQLTPVLKNTDYFVLNELEYNSLLGTSDPKEACEKLHTVTKNVKAIIKRGSEGCTMCLDEYGERIDIDAVPLEKLGLEVVNTVGCGDAFIGAFAAGKVEGLTHVEALRMAVAAGGFKATKKETRGSPTRDELNNLLTRWRGLSSQRQ
jgi:ribokinase